MPTIQRLCAMEILDSRGRPTVKAHCELAGRASASASVPSGASTGKAEAVELRDGDPKRYRGMGCRKAVANINGPIAEALLAHTFDSQQQLDEALIELDNTPNKSTLGGNALLAVSIAFARALAIEQGQTLYQQFAEILDQRITHLPRLTINLFSGGKHAGKQVAIQDVLIVPASPSTIDASLVMMHDIYHTAARRMEERYGMRLLTADEGGLAPPAESPEALFDAAVEAITEAGYEPGRDAAIAVDVASSHFYEPETGLYHIEPRPVDADGMIDRLADWCDAYPIVSIEDGLAEDDWDHWPILCERLGARVLILGDDLLCTNPARIGMAQSLKACNALLLKVNQVGTLTEAAEAYRRARSAGWHVTISVRSGETEDDWAADLAVGWQGNQFKNGSITQSERLAKYNRLLAIEAEKRLPIVGWPNPR